MSASILWEPEGRKHRQFGIGAPSLFLEQMYRAGLGLPCTLTETHIPVLQGMSAVSRDDDNHFDEIIEAIQTHGSIRVWEEY